MSACQSECLTACLYLAYIWFLLFRVSLCWFIYSDTATNYGKCCLPRVNSHKRLIYVHIQNLVFMCKFLNRSCLRGSDSVHSIYEYIPCTHTYMYVFQLYYNNFMLFGNYCCDKCQRHMHSVCCIQLCLKRKLCRYLCTQKLRISSICPSHIIPNKFAMADITEIISNLIETLIVKSLNYIL